MTFIAIAMLAMAAPAASQGKQLLPMSDIRVVHTAPSLAGITPPPLTTLVNMDLIVKPHPRGEPAIYELRSPQGPTAFKNQYSVNAKQAGYSVVTRGRLIIGVRSDGTSIRLRVIEAGQGSSVILTVRPPTTDRT